MKKLEGWILYNYQDYQRNVPYIELYKEEGIKREILIELLYIEELDFGVENSQWVLRYRGEKIPKPDFAIVRMNYPMLSRQLELLNIPVFNNSVTAEICNDKARTYQYVAQLSMKMADSLFVHKQFLEEYLKKQPRPYVVKSVSGHGGKQVFLVTEQTDRETLRNIGNQLEDHVVIQPVIGSKNQDVRVYVIGKTVVGAVLRTGKEFKSNFSLGGKAEWYSLSEEEKKQVSHIVDLFDFGMAGIDFILGDKGEFIFNEIEDVVGARMLYQCSNVNIVALYLDYIKKNVLKRL